MRVLYWVIVWIVFIFGGQLVIAASGLQLNKAALIQDWVEGETTESTLRLNAEGDWDWLVLGLSSKFFVNPVEDHYSSFDAKLVFPTLDDDLIFRTGYDWNDKYEIYNAKVNYSFQPYRKITIEFDYQAEERLPELISGCPYRLNNEMFAFTWESKPWKYFLRLTRYDKYYPEDPQYTSMRYRLEEEVSWRISPNLRLQLEYTENTGDYSAASYKDFWKEDWIIKGEYETQTKWHYSFEYDQLYWERGFEPYRYSQKVRFNIWTKFDPATKLNFAAVYRDLAYNSTVPDYSEPGVYQQKENDLKSRTESKIGLEFQFKISPYSWEIGTFYGNVNYDADSVSDNNRLGIYGAFVWKSECLDLSIKAAPVGDLTTQDAYYQVMIVYKPG